MEWIKINSDKILSMKYLLGSELADYIKERHLRQVSDLRINHKTILTLAIIVTVENPVTEIYIKLKSSYAADIGARVEIFRTNIAEITGLIDSLNNNELIHGIIIQLPLSDPDVTEKVVNQIDPKKDVDGLGIDSKFDPATPKAILWLLAGYNVELRGKKILVVGNGKLVGAPLSKILLNSDYDVTTVDDKVRDLKKITLVSDIIISATGRPHLITSDMLNPNSVIVDAGVASENNKTVGDVDLEVYSRDDLVITPVKGGVGPLTVCALFDNLILASKLFGD